MFEELADEEGRGLVDVEAEAEREAGAAEVDIVLVRRGLGL